MNRTPEYAIYLRKSRADLAAEARDGGDTLARHRTMLLQLAQKLALPVGRIYEEVRSGDSIAGRPQMQQLLADVRRGLWAGVLVAEVERLARGDTMDQGLVAQTFEYAAARIVTPLRIYDPCDPADREYFEFGLFMSRREYQAICRRLQAGRMSSAREGNFVGGQAPYGYRLARDAKGPTLLPIPHEADVVRRIFALAGGGMGPARIAGELESAAIPTRKGGPWRSETVRGILQNPVYVGKIRWKNRISQRIPGSCRRTRRSGGKDCLLTEGRHPPIISEESFAAAHQKKAQKTPPVPGPRQLQNPFAGLARCGLCHSLLRRGVRHGKAFLYCPTHGCGCSSVALEAAFLAVTQALAAWLGSCPLPRPSEHSTPPRQDALCRLKKQLESL
ncbi:MAG: recombinase family protein, partial [Christensenellaceae bacterium]|nr:recombinase family protein [Christensenellaceae bacterium]